MVSLSNRSGVSPLVIALFVIAPFFFVTPQMHQESWAYANFYGDSARGSSVFQKIFSPCGVDQCLYRSRPLGYLGEWFDATMLFSLNSRFGFGFRSLVQGFSVFAAAVFLWAALKNILGKSGHALALALFFTLSTPILVQYGIYFRSSKALAAAAVAGMLWMGTELEKRDFKIRRGKFLLGSLVVTLACFFDEQVPLWLFVIAVASGISHFKKPAALRCAGTMLGIFLLYLGYHFFVGPRVVALFYSPSGPDFLTETRHRVPPLKLLGSGAATLLREFGLIFGDLIDASPLSRGLAVCSWLGFFGLLLRTRETKRLPRPERNFAFFLLAGSLGMTAVMGHWHPAILLPEVSRVYYFQSFTVVFLFSVVSLSKNFLARVPLRFLALPLTALALGNLTAFPKTLQVFWDWDRVSVQKNRLYRNGKVAEMPPT